MLPEVLKRAIQARPVNAVCEPLERPTPPSMALPSGVASISVVNVPAWAEAKARFCQIGPEAEAVKQGGGPAAQVVSVFRKGFERVSRIKPVERSRVRRAQASPGLRRRQSPRYCMGTPLTHFYV